METNTKICQTCLSIDRQLTPASKILSVLKEIKCEELNYKSMCWECHSIVMKFYKFKLVAKYARAVLTRKFERPKTLSTLCQATKQTFDIDLKYNYDPLTNITPVEKYDVKQEFESTENVSELDFVDSDDDIKLQVFVDKIKKNEEEIKPTKPRSQDEREIQVDSAFLKANETFETVLLQETIEQKKTESQTKEKITEDDSTVLKKFKTVLLTEEEMLRGREAKRSHHNYKKTPFKCDTCVLGFTKKENYDLHIKKKHDKEIGAYSCEVCSTRFPTQPLLDQHRSVHFVIYACSLCDYKISAAKAALNHCRDKHALDEKHRIHCKQCDAVFRSPEELKDHVRTEHTLHCKDCGEKFKGQHTLRAHRVRIHAVKREFICDMCTKTFVTRSRMESHMIQHGQTVARRLAYCAICKIQYKNIQVYRSHVRNSVNHSQNRYQCTECNKKFASKVYLTKHYNFYHLKKSQYKCDACNKVFISKWRLNNHRQKHHGLSRSRDHACNECGKKFYTPTTLRAHMLTHSEKRMFMCSKCGDSFKQRPALYTHERRVHRTGNGNKGGE